jgi:hypothetical protein
MSDDLIRHMFRLLWGMVMGEREDYQTEAGEGTGEGEQGRMAEREVG